MIKVPEACRSSSWLFHRRAFVATLVDRTGTHRTGDEHLNMFPEQTRMHDSLMWGLLDRNMSCFCSYCTHGGQMDLLASALLAKRYGLLGWWCKTLRKNVACTISRR